VEEASRAKVFQGASQCGGGGCGGMMIDVTRSFWVWLHRWAGLAMTLFLVIVGLTGSLLAFYDDLERLATPQLFATPRPGEPHLDLATLAERALALVPQASSATVLLFRPDQADVMFVPRKDPATGKPYELGFNQLYLDPWTGNELGRRTFATLSEGWINLMPFIYDLHMQLALGLTGYWILGIVALVWTIDCFIGFYLTLPVTAASFWRRRKPAWLVKWKASAYRLNFDLHRASGLWLWPMLFIFAWSSVMFNLDSVYSPVTQFLFDYVPPGSAKPAQLPESNEHPRLDYHAAQEAGARLVAEQAAIHGFTVAGEPAYLSYDPRRGQYYYGVPTSLDVVPQKTHTVVVFDGETGALTEFHTPTGEHSGNTVTYWLRVLHMADVFGLPYRIFVCVLGLVITMLSVTGVYIWWMKRQARLYRRAAISHEVPALPRS
jgi:uncharacterized iron-regulated membrane protein